MRSLLILICATVLSIQSMAQNIQGIVTDLVNDKKYNFNFTIGSLEYDNNFLTSYNVNEKSNNPLRKVLVNYDKPNALIEVTLFRMNLKDTMVDKYSIKYHDSLGLIFTQRRTVTDFLKGTYELVLAFKDSSRTFIDVQQIMNQSTVYKKHYVFRLLTSSDIAQNKIFLQKLNTNLKTELPDIINKEVPKSNDIVQKPIEQPPTKVNAPKTDSTNKPLQILKQETPTKTVLTKPQETKPPTITQTPAPQPQSTNITSNSNSNKPLAPTQTNPPVVPPKTPPAPIPSSTIQNNAPAVTIFHGKLDSIDCLLVPTSHDMVCWQLIIKGGINNYPFLQQGIEPLLLNLLLNGATKSYSTEELELKKNNLMMQTDLYCTPDYSVLKFTFPLSSWNDAVKLLGEMLGKPAFNLGDIDEARGDVSIGVMTNKGDSWEQLRTLGTQIIYTGKAYDKTPWGEGLNLGSIQIDAIKKLYSAIINRNNISIAVHGKVNASLLRSALKTNFKWLNWGNSLQSLNPIVDISTSTLTIIKGENDGIATCISNAPRPFTSDYAAFMLAVKILEDRIIKTNAQKKLIDELQINYPQTNSALFFIQFTAGDADKAMQMIVDEVKRLKKTGMKPNELSDIKQNLIASFYLNNSKDDDWNKVISTASFYNNTALVEDFDNLLQKVTPSDIQQASIKYLKAFRNFYSGDSDAVNNLIFTQRLD